MMAAQMTTSNTTRLTPSNTDAAYDFGCPVRPAHRNGKYGKPTTSQNNLMASDSRWEKISSVRRLSACKTIAALTIIIAATTGVTYLLCNIFMVWEVA